MHSRQCFCRLGHWALEHFIALYLIIHVYSFKLEKKKEHVVEMYLHQFQTIYNKANEKQNTLINTTVSDDHVLL